MLRIFVSRVFTAKGLLINWVRGPSGSSPERRIVGVAGQEQDAEARPQGSRGFRELAAVHAGKPDIGRQQVDLHVGFEYPDSALGLVRLDHPVALVLQRLHHQHPDKAFVLDHQDGFTLVGGGRLRGRRHDIRRFGNAQVAGEIELHGRAMSFF